MKEDDLFNSIVKSELNDNIKRNLSRQELLCLACGTI
jgi:hypothetical protein